MQPDWITKACPKPNQSMRSAALARQAVLTKPAGSLGRLESLATDFAAWQAKEKPVLNTVAIRIFAGDHGICAQGVSAFPQEVTAQMVLNFIGGGAAISVLAKNLDADFKVINTGTVAPISLTQSGVQSNTAIFSDKQIAKGTADFSQAPAMTEQQLTQALTCGRDEVTKVVPKDTSTDAQTNVPACELFIGGEMGIGNSTSASALYSALLGLPAGETVGPGTGIDETAQAHKASVIDGALRKHKSQLVSPLEILRHLGGFEIAALTGAYISATQQGLPVLVDGFICTAAALLACEINPSARDWMLFAHRSAEPAHIKALTAMNALPLLDLQMRLGEGSGAAMAVPLIQNALALHSQMATFTDAGVSDKDD